MASDGQEYLWSWRVRSDQEWTVSNIYIYIMCSPFFLPRYLQCTNASHYLVAYYSLKLPGEPEYTQSSGCMLTVDEAYPHLIVGELLIRGVTNDIENTDRMQELLASLMIMRHIAAYNL